MDVGVDGVIVGVEGVLVGVERGLVCVHGVIVGEIGEPRV
jgi:hypothetical protein